MCFDGGPEGTSVTWCMTSAGSRAPVEDHRPRGPRVAGALDAPASGGAARLGPPEAGRRGLDGLPGGRSSAARRRNRRPAFPAPSRALAPLRPARVDCRKHREPR
jgi:hypothetical protein